MTTPTPENQPITEPEFVAVYGEYPIQVEGLARIITVNTAVAMEAAFCTASIEERSDERTRLSQLAKFVGHEALLPEHQWLLPETKN